MLDILLARPLMNWGASLRIPSWVLPCLLMEASALAWVCSTVSEAAAGLISSPLLSALWTTAALAWVLNMRGDIRESMLERPDERVWQRMNSARTVFGIMACLDTFLTITSPTAHGVLNVMACVFAATALSAATLQKRDGKPSA